jgi:hypothetical protein
LFHQTVSVGFGVLRLKGISFNFFVWDALFFDYQLYASLGVEENPEKFSGESWMRKSMSKERYVMNCNHWNGELALLNSIAFVY